MARAMTVVGLVVVLIASSIVLLTVVFVGGASGDCDGARIVQRLGDEDLDADQLHTVQVIIAVVDQRRLPDRAAVIAVSASLVETGLHNLAYGDRDSLGIFQQRPSQGWGSPEQIMDPVYATGKFLDALVALDWQTMTVGAAAQAVQRSAYPDRYGKRQFEAQRLVAGVRGRIGALPNPCVPPRPVSGSGAVERALSQLGMPYCWAGGSPTGPTPGDGSSPAPCGPRSPGYDCSGLMVYAFAPYVTLPRTSRTQYRAAEGTRVPVGQAQPGDLLFWARDTSNPETIHHVALVVAPGELVEAPEDGKTVRRRPYTTSSSGLMPSAVRMTP